MEQKSHYVGLTDAEVLENRQRNGINILTPPEKEPLWKKFWKISRSIDYLLLVAGTLSIGYLVTSFGGQTKMLRFFSNLLVFLLLFFWQQDWLSFLN